MSYSYPALKLPNLLREGEREGVKHTKLLDFGKKKENVYYHFLVLVG